MYQMKKGGKPKMQDGGNSTGAFAKSITVKKAKYDSATNKIKAKIDSTRNAFEQKLKDMKQKPKMKIGGESGPGPKKKKTINPETSINVSTRYGTSQIDTSGYSKGKFAYPFETKNSKGETVTKGMLRRKGVTEVLKKPKMAKGGFPDLTGDGKITKADILKGRGVFKKGGSVKKKK